MVKKSIKGLFAAVLCTVADMLGQNSPYLLPQNVLFQAGLDTQFVAKGALFLAALLCGTILIGRVLRRLFGFPVISGQIISGIILGPTGIDLANLGYFTQAITLTDQLSQKVYALVPADLFVFFIVLLSSVLTVSYLLWLAGYETNVKDLLKVGVTAVSAGFLGGILPIVLIGSALWFLYSGFFSFVTVVGVGLVFAATSVSIPVALLVSSQKMHLKSSQATLGAAIVDDILAVIMVSLFMLLVQSGALGHCINPAVHGKCSIGVSVVYMLFAALMLAMVGYYALVPLMKKMHEWKLGHVLAPLATIIMLGYFAFSELFGGLAGVTGAYFAGLFQRSADPHRVAEKAVSPFVNSILLPLFLGSIGLQINLKLLNFSHWLLVLLLLVLAAVSKMASCWVATMISNYAARRTSNKWTRLETYLFGASMITRGEVGLIIATLLRGADIITADLYIVCVVTIVMTTIIAPLLLTFGFNLYNAQLQEQKEGAYSYTLGAFTTIGIDQMFQMIAFILEKDAELNTTVRFSEGRKIIDIENDRVKVIFTPQKEILFEGDKRKIMALVSKIKHEIMHELEQISLQ